MKTKVLYIVTKSNWGGAQRHVFDLALSMSTTGYDVAVALGGNGELVTQLSTAGIRTISIPDLGRDVSITKDWHSFTDLWKIIKSERPEILHLHSPKAAGLGAFAGRLLGVKKIIYTVHGWAFNENRPPYQKALIAGMSWFTIMLSHKIVTLSRYETKQTDNFPFATKKIAFIPLGIKAQTFYSKKHAVAFLEKHLGISLTKKIVIGTISELHPNKGLTFLIEALRDIKADNVLTIIIGGGDQRELLEQKIKDSGLEGKVYLAGFVPNASDYLKAFDIFTLTSLKEGLPYAILEAGLAGIPCIASSVGGIPEMIDDMHSGILIRPQQSLEILHSIEFYIKHPTIRKEYGTHLKTGITEKFSIDAMVAATKELYTTDQYTPAS